MYCIDAHQYINMANNEAKPIGINTALPSPGKIVLGLVTVVVKRW